MIRTVRVTAPLLLLLCLAIRANAISLSQSIDKAAIDYEGRATFELTITWQGSQAAYRFDRPIQPSLEKLRVQEFSTSISSQGTGVAEVSTKKFTYSVVPTGSGTGRIEPMTIHYISWPDSLPGELVTEAMTVGIGPAKPKTNSGSLLGRIPILGIIIVWVVVAGGATTGLLLFVRSRRKKPREVVKTPVDLLLDKLAALKTDSGSDLKRFQTGIYKLLIWFLNTQYRLNITTQSAEEASVIIEASEMPKDAKEKICGWLLRADREKFSPLPPAPGETIRLETELREFFEHMKSRG